MKVMTRKTSVYILLALLFLFMASPADAQRCETVYETVMTLRPPLYGFPTVWDAIYEIEDRRTRLVSSVKLDNRNVLSLGYSQKPDSYDTEELFFVELNRRGRAMNKYAYKADPAEIPVKMIDLGGRYLVLSNVKDKRQAHTKKVRLSWYGSDGDYIRQTYIEDDQYFYEGLGVVRALEEEGFVVIIHAVGKDSTDDQHGVLVKFSDDGELLWKRAYRVGVANKLMSLAVFDKASYITTGRIKGEFGYMDGWIMKLGFDGAVLWQRTYPRGRYAILNDVDVMLSGRDRTQDVLVVSGNVLPIDGKPQASWVMGIDPLGEVRWQRFYRLDNYRMSKNWLRVLPDGRMTVIQNAEAVPELSRTGRSHIRMFTLSPRAVLMSDEAYTEGLQAQATDYNTGWNGERIVSAVTQSDESLSGKDDKDVLVLGISNPIKEEAGRYGEENRVYLQAPPEQAGETGMDDKSGAGPVQQGWVVVGTALDRYEDPCKSLFRR